MHRAQPQGQAHGVHCRKILKTPTATFQEQVIAWVFLTSLPGQGGTRRQWGWGEGGAGGLGKPFLLPSGHNLPRSVPRISPSQCTSHCVWWTHKQTSQYLPGGVVGAPIPPQHTPTEQPFSLIQHTKHRTGKQVRRYIEKGFLTVKQTDVTWFPSNVIFSNVCLQSIQFFFLIKSFWGDID